MPVRPCSRPTVGQRVPRRATPKVQPLGRGTAKAGRGGRIFIAGLAAVATICGVACSGAPAQVRGAAPSTAASDAAPASTTSTVSTAAQGCPQQILASLTDAQMVGQLFMIGDPLAAPDGSALEAIKADAVGGVILWGDSRQPLSAIRTLTDHLRAIDGVSRVGLYIATDQEGGEVQELSGPGFSAIPTAVAQGLIAPAQLRVDARQWGAQLAEAGLNVDLAPVLDVVPPAFEAINQPDARYDRQLGSEPSTVATHGAALVQGFQASGVAATLKHFPGLGRVVGDTDTTADVVDTLTTRDDPFLEPFAAGIQAGADFVMISLAIYQQIDPANQAAFSSVVIQDMLRRELGFRGLVISDDLGSTAAVADVAPSARAVAFLSAGGDIVLVVKPVSVVAPMVDAVLADVESSPSFRALIEADALAVLTAKANAGLLHCP